MSDKYLVNMNGEYPTHNEEWDDFQQALQWCDAQAKRGKCTYFQIKCGWGYYAWDSEDGGRTVEYGLRQNRVTYDSDGKDVNGNTPSF